MPDYSPAITGHATEFRPDTPGRQAARRARWEARCMAAMMFRNMGPCTLVDGEWVYGLTLAECARRVTAILDGQRREKEVPRA